MFENPDLSGRFRVDEKGEITIPLVGLVHVEGATAEEAAALIEKRFVEAQILQPAESHATVFIAEYATQGITVNGEVKSPGVYPALGVRKLNDVIAAAGGVTTAFAPQVVIAHSNDPGRPVTVDYNPAALKPVIPDVQILSRRFHRDSPGRHRVCAGNREPARRICAGRSALADRRGGNGACRRQRACRGAEPRAVGAEPWTMAGRKPSPIPVNKIYKGQAPDVALKDGDVLFIPTSTAKLITEQAVQSALGIGTQVAVYRTSLQ